MKKNLWYLFTLLCSAGLFVACGDDEKQVDESWKSLSKTYQVEANSITLSDVSLSGSEKSVVIDAVSVEAATIKLTNIVPDAGEVSINATLTKANDLYSLSGETTVDNCKIAISGSVSADGKLTLAATRTMSSAITGNLAILIGEMDYMPGVTMPYVPVHWKAVTGDEAVDVQLATVGPMLGGLIAGKVDAVNVTLSADGIFNVTWTKTGETDPTGMPDMVAGLIGNILYTVKDGTIYIALDKSVLSLVEMFAGVLEQSGINVTEILALMTDMGGYYGLPVSYVQANGVTTFIMKKEQLLRMLNVLSPILLPALPEGMQSFGQLLQLLPTAQELELGLPFISQ